MNGYKAFKKGLICKGFQYEEYETYEMECEPSICNKGFHFCENPLDVLSYYDLCDSEFSEVEALGDCDCGDKMDTKVATNKIKIGAKIDLKGFINASISFIFEKCKTDTNGKIQASSGHSSQLASSGHYSQLAASGDYSQLAASGDSSQLDLQGQHSIGAGIGYNDKVKGKKSNWITLAEWKYDEKLKQSIPICVKSAQIDGEILKEDTWYKLENCEFTEVK